jgi:hypothetical protein
MTSKQLFFFADRTDMEIIIQELEKSMKIRYVRAGLFDSPEPEYFSSLLDLTNLGYAPTGDWNLNDFVLIVASQDEINVRTVQQRKGGNKYAIDQEINPKSVLIVLSGIYNDNVLVAGKIGTISSNPFSSEVFLFMTKLVKRHFIKKAEFYLGPAAKSKLENGWRLVTNVTSPTEYDIKL